MITDTIDHSPKTNCTAWDGVEINPTGLTGKEIKSAVCDGGIVRGMYGDCGAKDPNCAGLGVSTPDNWREYVAGGEADSNPLCMSSVNGVTEAIGESDAGKTSLPERFQGVLCMTNGFEAHGGPVGGRQFDGG